MSEGIAYGVCIHVTAQRNHDSRVLVPQYVCFSSIGPSTWAVMPIHRPTTSVGDLETHLQSLRKSSGTTPFKPYRLVGCLSTPISVILPVQQYALLNRFKPVSEHFDGKQLAEIKSRTVRTGNLYLFFYVKNRTATPLQREFARALVPDEAEATSDAPEDPADSEGGATEQPQTTPPPRKKKKKHHRHSKSRGKKKKKRRKKKKKAKVAETGPTEDKITFGDLMQLANRAGQIE